MRPSALLEMHREDIRQIVLAYRAANPRVFGSVATGSDLEGSDLDLLVDALPEKSLFDQGAIAYRLEALLHIKVDVVTSSGLRGRIRERVLLEAVAV